MTTKIKYILASILVSILLTSPVPIQAASVFSICQSNSSASQTSVCNTINKHQANNSNPVLIIIKTVINILSYITGIIALIIILISGARFMISSGDPNRVTTAKNSLIYAIVGIVIFLSAQLIVTYVLNNVG